MRSIVPIRALKPFKAVGFELQGVHIQLDDIIHHRNILFKEAYKADGDCEDVPILAGNICSATGTIREVQKGR